jgi:uncharacterized damage-inducible protein DinB
MKHTRSILLFAVLVLAVATLRPTAGKAQASPHSQQSQQPAPTIASSVDRQIGTIEKDVVSAAEAMPEDKFNFSPENANIPNASYKGVRTFAQQIKHIATANYFFWSSITGDKLPEGITGPNGPENIKTKAEIVKYLKDSYALGHKAAATLNASNIVEEVAMPGRPNKASRLYLATFAVAHGFDHYGQMVEYMRMNGIVPPASQGQ